MIASRSRDDAGAHVAVPRKVFVHYTRIRDRKLGYCDALERQFLLEIHQVEWANAFLLHLRKALGPANFLMFKHRHDLFVDAQFRPAVALATGRFDALPSWLMQTVRVSGTLKVGPTRPPPVAQALSGMVQKDDGLVPKLFFVPKGVPQSPKEDQRRGSTWGPFQDVLGPTDPTYPVVAGHGQYFAYDPDAACLEAAPSNENQDPRDHQSPVFATPEMRQAGSPTSIMLRTYYDSAPAPQPSATLARIRPANVPLSQEPVENLHPLFVASSDVEGYHAEPELLPQGVDDPPEAKRPSPTDVELWDVLKADNYAPLLLLLNACPAPSLSLAMGSVCNAASWMGDLEATAGTIIVAETDWLTRRRAGTVGTRPTLDLIPALVSHVVASNQILVKADRSFFERHIQPSLSRLQTSIQEPVSGLGQNPATEEADRLLHRHARTFEDAASLLVASMTRCRSSDIPATVRALLSMLAKSASGLRVTQYPARLEATKDERLRLTPYRTLVSATNPPCSPGIAMCVEALLRWGVADRITRRAWDMSSRPASMVSADIEGSPYAQTSACLAMVLLLKQISGAVWRLKEVGIDAGHHGLSDDREIFLQTEARNIFAWMRNVVFAGPTAAAATFATDWIDMPALGHMALLHLADMIVALDASFRRGTYAAARRPGQPMTATFNESVVLAAMTFRSRLSPLGRRLDSL